MGERSGERLPREFYARPSVEVAPDLLGRVLVRILPDGIRLAARIVETEAYREDDPASHSFRGRTARTEVMFGPPGRLYVYFTYGMWFCMNAVTGADGEGSAVLFRAAEPLEGIDRMTRLRRTGDPRLLLSGPARLCGGLGVSRVHDGADLVDGDGLLIEAGEPVAAADVLVGPRIGITAGVSRPWRFSLAGSPNVSRGRPGPPPPRVRARR
ncbi:MAG: DNA-3-methyladenine glycosylase [Actinobacteria bacterium]|nr:DNA-3-methyladenine glycosylase [Actinomycetota bacterium]